MGGGLGHLYSRHLSSAESAPTKVDPRTSPGHHQLPAPGHKRALTFLHLATSSSHHAIGIKILHCRIGVLGLACCWQGEQGGPHRNGPILFGTFWFLLSSVCLGRTGLSGSENLFSGLSSLIWLVKYVMFHFTKYPVFWDVIHQNRPISALACISILDVNCLVALLMCFYSIVSPFLFTGLSCSLFP